MYKSLEFITNNTELAQTTNFTTVQLLSKGSLFVKGYALVQNIVVSTPSAGTFTSVLTGSDYVLTKVAHGMKLGLKVRVSTTTTLPNPLAAATDYFVVPLTANTFALATSLVNANAGTVITVTNAGTGTHTITPTALAGGTYQLQVSLDNVLWINSGSAVNITASADVLTEKLHPMYNYVRNVYTLTAGQLNITEYICIKGN